MLTLLICESLCLVLQVTCFPFFKPLLLLFIFQLQEDKKAQWSVKNIIRKCSHKHFLILCSPTWALNILSTAVKVCNAFILLYFTINNAKVTTRGLYWWKHVNILSSQHCQSGWTVSMSNWYWVSVKTSLWNLLFSYAMPIYSKTMILFECVNFNRH